MTYLESDGDFSPRTEGNSKGLHLSNMEGQPANKDDVADSHNIDSDAVLQPVNREHVDSELSVNNYHRNSCEELGNELPLRDSTYNLDIIPCGSQPLMKQITVGVSPEIDWASNAIFVYKENCALQVMLPSRRKLAFRYQMTWLTLSY